MNRKMIFLAVAVLALVSLACTLNINIPDTQLKTGPTVTDNINVPFPADSQDTTDVSLKFGAGELTLEPGAEDGLVSGTAAYNVADFKPEITVDGNNVNIEQGNLKFGGIPYINKNIVNEWNLSLANKPISLSIDAGAYTGDYELGGLSIHRLEVRDGASKVRLGFSEPNQVEMTFFEYTTGASDVRLSGLGNANLTELVFKSGAGTYTLDFSGELARDMDVTIESGVSTVTIIVPEGVAAEVDNESSLITVNTSGNWEQHGTNYLITGTGYKITFHTRLGAGTLRLETR